MTMNAKYLRNYKKIHINRRTNFEMTFMIYLNGPIELQRVVYERDA